jgi:tetratricopeptide (TPR) repeat protein
MQFLHELTAAVACELGRPPSEQVTPSLQRAAHPHNLIRQVPAQAPASEFREAIVCRLLQEAHPDVSPERLQNALRQVLLRWFADGGFLKHPEAGHLYTCLLESLDQADARQDPTNARTRLHALAEHFVWLHGTWEFRDAAMQLAPLHELARVLPEWPSLEVLPFDLQFNVILNGFLPQQNLSAALRWCDELLEQLPSNATTVEGLRQRNLISNLHADALIERDGAKAMREVRQTYLNVVASFKQLRQQIGDSPQTLQDEASSLARLGDLELAQGDRAGARKHYAAELKLCQRWRQKFGDSPQAMRDLLVSLAKLGDLELAEGNRVGAKRHCEAALKLSQELRQLIGDSPQTLRDEAICLGKLREVESAEGDQVRAKRHCEAKLKLSQQLRQLIGDSPQTLQDEAGNLVTLSNLEVAEGDWAGARQHCTAALQLWKQLRQQFGESPEALQHEAMTHVGLAAVAGTEQAWAEAVTHMEPALALFRLLIERHQLTPKRMQSYRMAARHYIMSCEKSGQPQRAQPVRQWLDGLKSAQPDGSSSGGV